MTIESLNSKAGNGTVKYGRSLLVRVVKAEWQFVFFETHWNLDKIITIVELSLANPLLLTNFQLNGSQSSKLTESAHSIDFLRYPFVKSGLNKVITVSGFQITQVFELYILDGIFPKNRNS